ncbi:hypothetical protein E5D57_005490 [Metarhizium anisopliae]|nr:hypothetical protein E5D57_005490 [Metarhizium anisopliae]
MANGQPCGSIFENCLHVHERGGQKPYAGLLARGNENSKAARDWEMPASPPLLTINKTCYGPVETTLGEK